MFQFLFKYPAAVFSKGSFVLLGRWPVWMLALLIGVCAAAVGILIWQRRRHTTANMHGLRTAAVWLLQSSLIALLLLLLWQPAMSISELKPQQNIVAVLVDDSASMSTPDESAAPRIDRAKQVLNSGLLQNLQQRFQVRLYRVGARTERAPDAASLQARETATHLGPALREIVNESATLPIGAILLLSDGADNSGGIDADTMAAIHRQHIPIHTIGFGRVDMLRDVEISSVQVPARTLANARVQATLTLHEGGYEARHAKLSVNIGGKTLATRDVVFKRDGAPQTEQILFDAGDAGVKDIQFRIDPLADETNLENNAITRVVYVSPEKKRILYVEGEPRWDYKFLRRAIDEDKSVQLVSMLRTTENKIYRQGVSGPNELADGFPSKVEDLFSYDAIVLGSVEANYFTVTQQELIHEFVDRRGGGLLFMGGRAALADGGYSRPPFTDLLPVRLPDRKNTFHRDPAYAALAPAGRDSLICRLEDDPDRNVARWKTLPYLMDYQEAGTPKPGALVLADITVAGRKMPLLVTQNYGRGRTAVFATGGDWRWQMLQPVSDMSHEMFWRQFLRWLSSDTPSRVVASSPATVLSDDGHARLRAEVRDTTFLPTSDAQVTANIVAPDGSSHTVDLRPDPQDTGVYTADWDAPQAGAYVVEVSAKRGNETLGRDVLTLRRENGIAENFHREQNRELLQRLASETGGRYWPAADASRIPGEISYSEAGLTVRQTKDLWNMPAIFLLALALCSAQWLLRRKWGVV